MEEKDLKEKIKARIEGFKTKLDELNVQINLGEAEAKEWFHGKSDEMAALLEKSKEKLKNFDSVAQQKTDNLRAKIEELRVQVNLGKAEAEDKLSEQSDKIEQIIQSTAEEIKALKSEAGEKAHEFSDELEELMTDLKTRFETYRVKLALGQADAEDKLKEKKEELQQKISGAKQKLTEKLNEEKWQQLGNELSESIDHVKKGFQKFFS